MESLSQALSRVSTAADKKLMNYANQGEISGSEINELRAELKSQINLDLATQFKTAYSISDFPLMSDMVYRWIETQVAQLERKVRSRALTRKYDYEYIKYKDLRNQYSNSKENSLVKEMVRSWAYENYDISKMENSLARVLSYLSYRVIPILDTFKPGLASSVSSEFVAFVDQITLDTQIFKISEELKSYIDKLNFAEITTLYARGQKNQKLVISFPKTMDTPGRSDAMYVTDKTIEGETFYTSLSSWPSVPFAEANRVWNDFVSDKPELSLNVTVDDIYNPSFFKGVIECDKKTPFVTSMSVLFVIDNEQGQDLINRFEPHRSILLPGQIGVPNEKGMDYYTVSNVRFQRDSVPIRFGIARDALNIVSKTEAASRGAANGITPIGTFRLSGIKVLKNDYDVKPLIPLIREILLVFQYDSLSADGSLDWIPNCRYFRR